jgi:hypothetical protein
MSVYNKYVRLKSIKIFGRCLWINRNLLHHFSFYLYSVQISNFATWSGLNFKTNVEVVLFKWENLIKTIWWLSVTSIFIKNEAKVTWLRLDFGILLSRWLSYCTWCCFTSHFRRLYIHYYILVWLLSIKVILCLQNTQIRRDG